MALTHFSLYESTLNESNVDGLEVYHDDKTSVGKQIYHTFYVEHPKLGHKRVYINTIQHRDSKWRGEIEVGGNDPGKLGSAVVRHVMRYIRQVTGINQFGGERESGAGRGRYQKIDFLKEEIDAKLENYSVKKENKDIVSHTFVFSHRKKSEPTVVTVSHHPSSAAKIAFAHVSGKKEDANKLGSGTARFMYNVLKSKLPSNIQQIGGVRNTGARGEKRTLQMIPLKENIEPAKIEKKNVYLDGNGMVQNSYKIHHPNLKLPIYVHATKHPQTPHQANLNVGGNDVGKLGVAVVRQIMNYIANDMKVTSFAGPRYSGARAGKHLTQYVNLKEEDHKIEKIENKKIEDKDNTYHLVKYKVTTPNRTFTIKGWKYEKDKQFYVSDIDGNVEIGSKDYNTVGKTTIRKIAQHIKNDLQVTHFAGQRVGGARRGPARDRNRRYEGSVVKIKESEEHDPFDTEDLEEFSQHLREKHGGHIDLYWTREHHINLQTIIVPKQLRGQGVASAMINDVKHYADRHQVKIILSAEPLDKSTKKGKLIKFYKSHGFVENKGRHKDYALGGFGSTNTMYQDPNKKPKRRNTNQHAAQA